MKYPLIVVLLALQFSSVFMQTSDCTCTSFTYDLKNIKKITEAGANCKIGANEVCKVTMANLFTKFLPSTAFTPQIITVKYDNPDTTPLFVNAFYCQE